MWKNRIKLALRHLWKEKTFTAINIFGLAIGLSAAMAIFLYASYHFSYDRFHQGADHIFRVLTIDRALGVSSSEVGITTPAAGPTAAREITGVRSQVRVIGQGQNLLQYQDRSIYAEQFAFADSNFFEFFNFPLLHGDPDRVLREPNKVLLSLSLAEKLFPGEEAVGKQLQAQHTGNPVLVEGVFEDIPDNSHLQFDMVVSLIPAPGDSNSANFLSTWQSIAAPTYVYLDEPSNWQNITDQLLQIGRENNYGENFDLTMQPLLKAHMYSTELLFDNHNTGKTDIGQIRNLLLVAFFLILIAAFNFMNLSTARSGRRSREIGMRKVLGASKSQLVMQFLFESVVLVLISFIMALVILSILSGNLGISVPNGFTSYLFSESHFVWYSLLLILLLGLLSGLYPALVLSSFEPVAVLKGQFGNQQSAPWLRRFLVTLQFTVSIAVIIGMIIVRHQVEYMSNKDMGFEKDFVLTINLNVTQTIQNAATLRDEIEKLEGVQGVAFANALPGTGYGRNSVTPEEYSGDETWIFSVCGVDQDFADVLGIDILDGRFYDRGHTADLQNSVVVNEAAAAALGWSDAVGRKITINNTERTIIGVVRNFHYVGLRYPIEPLLLMPLPQPGGTLTVKLSSTDISGTIGAIQGVWRTINANYPFEHQFFDDQFHQLFTDDERFASVLTNFNWLAILIACLGLFGLTAYTVQQKTRELGIRKVLGAELKDVIAILGREFWWILLIANLIAIPVSFYYMQRWLNEFVYRIEMTPWPFVAALVVSVLVAFLTISLQALRAERNDPVKALKQE